VSAVFSRLTCPYGNNASTCLGPRLFHIRSNSRLVRDSRHSTLAFRAFPLKIIGSIRTVNVAAIQACHFICLLVRMISWFASMSIASLIILIDVSNRCGFRIAAFKLHLSDLFFLLNVYNASKTRIMVS
jgi:hypothetical protein